SFTPQHRILSDTRLYTIHLQFFFLFFFFFTDPATTEIYTLSLHDALPISIRSPSGAGDAMSSGQRGRTARAMRSASRSTPSGARSEEHTSELQSRFDLVCRLLLEKKKFTGFK